MEPIEFMQQLNVWFEKAVTEEVRQSTPRSMMTLTVEMYDHIYSTRASFFNCLHYRHGTSNFCCCIRLKNIYFLLRSSNLYTGVVLPLHCNLSYLQELWSAPLKSSWLNCGNKLIDPPLWKSYCTLLDALTLAYHDGCTPWFAIRGWQPVWHLTQDNGQGREHCLHSTKT
jgi:hypothetical protein